MALIVITIITAVIQVPTRIDGAPAAVGYCPPPDLPEATSDGSVVKAAPGTVVRVSCRKQYVEAHPSVTCNNGQWSAPQPPCKLVSCEFPSLPSVGYLDMPCRDLNCTITYSCPKGFLYSGTVRRYCQRDETWSGEAGECEVVRCPLLPVPAHGRINQEDRRYSANTTITCDEGYIYSKPQHSTRRCQGDKTWDGEEGICEAILCPVLPNPPNGHIMHPDRSYRAAATVLCDRGYVYSNPHLDTRVCQIDNTWSVDEGTCEPVACPEIRNVENGVMSSTSGRFKDNVVLQCQSGYERDGPSTIWCMADGNWSSEIGQCREKGSIAVIISPILAVMFASVVVIALYSWCRRRKLKRLLYEKTMQEKPNQEEIPFLKKESLHCSFLLKEDFGEAFANEELHTQNIVEGVQTAIACQMRMEVGVSVTYLCKQSRTVYIDIHSPKKVDISELTKGISQTFLRRDADQETQFDLIETNSIIFREQITHLLVAAIEKRRHMPDKQGDKKIDIETQYVRLKLLPSETMGAIPRIGCERRPDRYQRELESQDQTDINEEDLLSHKDSHKYLLIRGRAGIGKSTLLQRLLWKWANGDWATKFKAFFLINMRYLMTLDRPLDLPQLMCLYTLYGTESAGVVIDKEWFEENQDKIGFIMDGMDEIQDFKEYWKEVNSITDTGVDAKPLEWCFAIMKRGILKMSTVIISSRPFASLILIGQHLQTTENPEKMQTIELLGLTRSGVSTFIHKNVDETHRTSVEQTLLKNPILLSASAITFYCAALCQVLVGEDSVGHHLTTYTQITVYIMKMFIERSIKKGRMHSLVTEDIPTTLVRLSELASDGLLNPGPSGLPRLIFHEKDFRKTDRPSMKRSQMRRIGLLMDTDMKDPTKPGENQVLSQFVHLSIQEVLAMVGLINKSEDQIENVVKQLARSQQFDMALLFLYGLVFDTENEYILQLFPQTVLTSSQKSKVRPVLLKSLGSMSSDLQAIQIAHESQSVDVAQAVCKQRFQKEVCIARMKLTVIDMIAIIFVLRHHSSTNAIKLEDIDIDMASIKELAHFLIDTKDIRILELNDENIDDEGIAELMKGIKVNTSLTTLGIWSNALTRSGVKSLAEGLQENKTLDEVNIISEGITDETVEHISHTLKANTIISKLGISSKHLTDKGVEVLAEALQVNSTLKHLRLQGFSMKDNGVKAILDALSVNHGLDIWIDMPDCSQNFKKLVEEHKGIHTEL